METKNFNRVTYTFMINGEAISLYCSTTRTRTGFCHHVYTWGCGADGQHTRLSYYNRTWERFDYETALKSAANKLRKKYRAPLLLEIDNIGRNESEKCERFIQTFKANFAALSDEQKKFVADHTPHLETMKKARFVTAGVALMAACR